MTASIYDFDPSLRVSHCGRAATVDKRWWFHLHISACVYQGKYEDETYRKRTKVTAGNSNEHLSGLVLQTAAVIGSK